MKSLFALAAMMALTPSITAQERIVPEGWQESYEFFHYAPAVRAGDFVYLSGVVASLGEDETDEDLAAAFDRAFRLIADILNEAGGDWGDVVEMTSYHTELIAQVETFMAVKDNWIPEPYPAWTAIDVDRLYPERGLVEIKVTAYMPRTADAE